MQYPNAVHFAFVPAIVEFTQVIANIAGIRLELTAGEPGAMYRDERSVGPGPILCVRHTAGAANVVCGYSVQ